MLVVVSKILEIGSILISLYLILLSYFDIRQKKVSIKMLGMGMIFISLLSILGLLYREMDGLLALFGLVVGIGFLIFSKLSREAFGYGDSILILMLGVYLGFWQIMYVLLFAFLLSALFSIGFMIWKGISKKVSIPFIPFLAISYMVLYFWEVIH
ncbi:MAG: prepilin peptidase [Lachnospiraceae bacterium]|nr:prepilin peptidase [Lachnospiraceae bacterium]